MRECIIVGAGGLGMLTAYALLQQGITATIIERGAVGREASWAGGGILSPLYPWNYPDAVNRLASLSQAGYPDLLEHLRQESGIDPEWNRCGMLLLDPGERQQIESWAERFGAQVGFLSGSAVAEIEPGITSQGEVAWMPQVGQVRNPRLLKSLRAYLEQRGVTFIEQQPVESVAVANGRVTGVKTAQAVFFAERVVVASGAWSTDLLADLGMKLPIRPVRGQMLLFKAEPGVVSRIILQGRRYLIPRRDGRVVVGSTMEEVGFDKTTTREAFDELKAFALELMPGLARFEVEAHWAGLRPARGDGVPFIGAYPGVEGLFVNAGHFRNGIVMGLASAQLLAGIIVNSELPLDPAAYAVFD